MSARRKPIAEQTKHRSQSEKKDKILAESLVKTSNDKLLKPPAWLTSDLAKKKWREVVPELMEIDIVGNLDVDNIAGFCNAYANYRRATEQLYREDLVVEKVDAQTGASIYKVNPLVSIQIKYAAEMRKFEDLCGMTINSRLKAGQAKVDSVKQSIIDDFGDIL